MTVATERALPAVDAIAGFFAALLGRPVTVAKDASPAPRGYPTAGAIYASGDGETGAILACDLVAAASLGAALSRMPPGRVDDAIRAGQLDELLLDNFHEIANVITRLFNPPAMQAVRPTPLVLATVYAGPDAAASLGMLAKARTRVDASLIVQGYRAGRVTLAYT